MNFYKTKDIENKPVYAFTFKCINIINPYESECGRFEVKPRYYRLNKTEAMILNSINTLPFETTRLGGGFYGDIYTLPDNKIIVINEGLIGLYASFEAFDTYFDEGDTSLYTIELGAERE
jgi:hypothetical protein